MSPAPGQINVEHEFSEKLTIHKNLNQEVIVITVDRVRLCLLEHRDKLVRQKEWLIPLGLLASLITTLVAADFKKVLLSAAVWQAIYLIGVIICFIWLIVAIYNAWKYRNLCNVDKLIEKMMARQIDEEKT